MIKDISYPKGDSVSHIKLIGTVHVSKNSVQEVTEAIQTWKPDIVAVELCDSRIDINESEDFKKSLNIKSALLRGKMCDVYGGILGKLESEFAKYIGSDLGGEMLAAVNEGEAIGAEIRLIDQDVFKTMDGMWKDMSAVSKVKETFKCITAIALLRALRIFKANLSIDLEELEAESVENNERIEKIPYYQTLVVDRNIYMTNNIIKATEKEKVLVVVGSAHVPGIVDLLRQHNKDITVSEPVKVAKEKKVVKKYICDTCKCEGEPEFKGLLNREVKKCNCGTAHYFVSMNLRLIRFRTEMKPETKSDTRILKLIFGKKFGGN